MLVFKPLVLVNASWVLVFPLFVISISLLSLQIINWRLSGRGGGCPITFMYIQSMAACKGTPRFLVLSFLFPSPPHSPPYLPAPRSLKEVPSQFSSLTHHPTPTLGLSTSPPHFLILPLSCHTQGIPLQPSISVFILSSSPLIFPPSDAQFSSTFLSSLSLPILPSWKMQQSPRLP